ncbi:hypothetical protein [Tropicimonas sp. S265A]|uniref:hypothetical protein n=1 Tax=Tropicimonas sp. S265A TaxID=3415134 RepID=UPI003C7E32B9
MPRSLLYTLILAPLAAAALTVAIAAGLSDRVAPGAGGGLMALSLFAMIAAVAIWVLRRAR